MTTTTKALAIMHLSLFEIDDADVDNVDAHLLRSSDNMVQVLHDVEAGQLLVPVDLRGKT
jgi:hypothetical protein